jgi:hypothetical protein
MFENDSCFPSSTTADVQHKALEKYADQQVYATCKLSCS